MSPDVIIFVPDDDRRGGMQRSAINIYDSLRAKGLAVKVLCVKLFPDGYSSDNPDVKAMVPDCGSKSRFWLAFFKALRREIISRRQSAWVALGLTPTLMLLILSLFYRPRTMIGSERIHPAMETPPPWIRLARFLLFRRLDYVVIQSEGSRKWTRERLGVADSRIKLVPNVVLTPRPVDCKRVSQDDYVVACVGRLTAQKGFDYGLEIYARVREHYPAARLVIVGDGPERDSLRALAKSLKVCDSVDFQPSTPNLNEFWSKVDILLFPSRYEGFPNVLAEAMAHGLPSVAFDCPTGPSDIITSGINGYLVKVGDIDGAARHVRDLLGDPEQRRSIGHNARQVSSEFSPEVVGDLWAILVR